MRKDLISKAIGDIGDELLMESFAYGNAPERTKNMGKYESRNQTTNVRKFYRIAFAVGTMLILAATAYATNIFGIRDLYQDLPEEAVPYIQEHTETAALEEWSARITESLCDDSTILVTVTVSGGDKYIIAPTDADPNTLAVNIGIEGNQTLGEYAAEQGKELLFVGASLKENSGLGGIGSQNFENTSPSEMNILVEANTTGELTEKEILCHVYAVDRDWNKQTLDIPFMLEKAPSDSGRVYAPVNADAIPGLTVDNAMVTETPMGTTIRFMENITDDDAWENIKKVEFDGLKYGEGGNVLEDDGNWYFTVSGCTGNVGEKLTAYYYDWDDNMIGEIVFELK